MFVTFFFSTLGRLRVAARLNVLDAVKANRMNSQGCVFIIC